MADEVVSEIFNLSSISLQSGTPGELGTGLGLQLVKEYVAFHGCEIWAESQLAVGTNVHFSMQNIFSAKK